MDANCQGGAANSDARNGKGMTFGCLSSMEADLIAEVEVHVCAALRHLARASEQEAAAARAARMGPGASRGRVGFEAMSNLVGDTMGVDECSGCELSSTGSGCEELPTAQHNEYRCQFKVDTDTAADDMGDPSPVASTRAGNDGSESGGDWCESSTSGAGMGPAFAACLERLIEVTWAFLLRVQLIDAVLRGDVLQSAAWSVRFLGLAEPWGLRRVQELTLHALELLADDPETLKLDSDAALDTAWDCLREACAAYLGAPIIPRFEARLKRSVERLAKLGLRRPRSSGCSGDSGSNGSGSPNATSLQGGQQSVRWEAALEKTLSALLEPDGGAGAGSQGADSGRAPRQFDGSGRGLRAFRSADRLYASFRRALVEATAGHPDGCCHLDARTPVLVGAEAAALLSARGPWSDQKRRQLSEVLGCIPLQLLPSATLQVQPPGSAPAPHSIACSHSIGLEPGGLDDASDEGCPAAAGLEGGGILLEDVQLDVEKLLAPRRTAGLPGTPKDAAQDPWGLCCSGGNRALL